MDNPVLVEVTRGNYIESVHRGAIAIVDAAAKTLVGIGDIEKPVFPRSAIKPLQTLYLAESGAVEKLGLDAADIALACASHNGEKAHVDGVAAMLAKAGLLHECLECGPQWPKLTADCGALIAAGKEPGAVHNNCSGKHADFVCAAHHLGEKVAGYVMPDHPVQRELKAILETLSGHAIDNPAEIATDGCSIPTYALPLRNLARAFARFAAANGMGAGRDRAARTIHAACTAHPHMVAGTGRFDSEAMAALGSSVLLKTGAEGVYAGMIPHLGLGVALKCDDGGTRAAEAMMAACLVAILKDVPDRIADSLADVLKNRNGWTVGAVRVADGLLARLGKAVA